MIQATANQALITDYTDATIWHKAITRIYFWGSGMFYTDPYLRITCPSSKSADILSTFLKNADTVDWPSHFCLWSSFITIDKFFTDKRCKIIADFIDENDATTLPSDCVSTTYKPFNHDFCVLS